MLEAGSMKNSGVASKSRVLLAASHYSSVIHSTSPNKGIMDVCEQRNH